MAKKRKGRSAAFMRSINPFLKAKRRSSRRSRSRNKSTGVKKMSRRSRSYSSGGFLGISMREAGASMVYGAAREKMSQVIQPYTTFLPLGALTDEAGMILVNSLLMKYVFKKESILRSALRTGVRIEFARIGEAAVKGQLNLGFLSGSSGSTSSGNIF